jgi:Tfp pilus assembly protein PilV
MSLKSTSGTSLTEVMVMMVILGISIVGIYSMVDSGRKLANLTDTRLSAINIAREGLESVATLRDTFALKWYDSGACGWTSAFFSLDEQILINTPSNCPQELPTTYILKDDKTLTVSAGSSVCINELGWYSQEQSMSSGADNTNCQAPTFDNKCSCADTLTLCGKNITQECKTNFKRDIIFTTCDAPIDLEYCVEVNSKVVWWTEDADDTLELSQIMTPLD